uniref:Integrase core domain containing protein n=2 Tax=Solanum tuberosum TaxID=4113 RepID=M1DZH1_SOLTU
MARLITEERRVLTGSLHTVPDIHRLFNLHKCDSYAATLRGSISKRSKPLAQDPLTSTMVQDCPMDISPAIISRFLYGPTTGHSWSLNTAEDSGVPIWHCDRLIHPTGALDIGLIRDEANVAAPRKEPEVEVPPLGADLADTVGQAQGGDPSIPDHTDTVSASSSQVASMAPSSSWSTPQFGAVVVPLARVQKLEAQMATLLHHIQPWMQKSIAKSEARIERRMEGMMNRKIQDANKRLDAFELRVLERPDPTIDLSSFQFELASLRDDVHAILATPTIDPQAAPTALADYTVLDALFSGTAEEEPEPIHAKGELSSALLVEVPLVVRDVVSTTKDAMIDDVGTTKGDPTNVSAGSGKPDPPGC